MQSKSWAQCRGQSLERYKTVRQTRFLPFGSGVWRSSILKTCDGMTYGMNTAWSVPGGQLHGGKRDASFAGCRLRYTHLKVEDLAVMLGWDVLDRLTSNAVDPTRASCSTCASVRHGKNWTTWTVLRPCIRSATVQIVLLKAGGFSVKNPLTDQAIKFRPHTQPSSFKGNCALQLCHGSALNPQLNHTQLLCGAAGHVANWRTVGKTHRNDSPFTTNFLIS